jgi:hypothetical protein
MLESVNMNDYLKSVAISAVVCGLAFATGCQTAAEKRGEYVDPHTGLVEGVRSKGDGKNVLGWQDHSREIERSLGY